MDPHLRRTAELIARLVTEEVRDEHVPVGEIYRTEDFLGLETELDRIADLLDIRTRFKTASITRLLQAVRREFPYTTVRDAVRTYVDIVKALPLYLASQVHDIARFLPEIVTRIFRNSIVKAGLIETIEGALSEIRRYIDLYGAQRAKMYHADAVARAVERSVRALDYVIAHEIANFLFERRLEDAIAVLRGLLENVPAQSYIFLRHLRSRIPSGVAGKLAPLLDRFARDVLTRLRDVISRAIAPPPPKPTVPPAKPEVKPAAKPIPTARVDIYSEVAKLLNFFISAPMKELGFDVKYSVDFVRRIDPDALNTFVEFFELRKLMPIPEDPTKFMALLTDSVREGRLPLEKAVTLVYGFITFLLPFVCLAAELREVGVDYRLILSRLIEGTFKRPEYVSALLENVVSAAKEGLFETYLRGAITTKMFIIRHLQVVLPFDKLISLVNMADWYDAVKNDILSYLAYLTDLVDAIDSLVEEFKRRGYIPRQHIPSTGVGTFDDFVKTLLDREEEIIGAMATMPVEIELAEPIVVERKPEAKEVEVSAGVARGAETAQTLREFITNLLKLLDIIHKTLVEILTELKRISRRAESIVRAGAAAKPEVVAAAGVRPEEVSEMPTECIELGAGQTFISTVFDTLSRLPYSTNVAWFGFAFYNAFTDQIAAAYMTAPEIRAIQIEALRKIFSTVEERLGVPVLFQELLYDLSRVLEEAYRTAESWIQAVERVVKEYVEKVLRELYATCREVAPELCRPYVDLGEEYLQLPLLIIGNFARIVALVYVDEFDAALDIAMNTVKTLEMLPLWTKLERRGYRLTKTFKRCMQIAFMIIANAIRANFPVGLSLT